MNLTKNQGAALIIAVAVAGALWWWVHGKHRTEPSLVEAVASPSAVTDQYSHWVGHGHGDMVFHRFADSVITNCTPEAIQVAEGTVSVSAIPEAPGYEEIPSQLGGARG